MSWPFAPKPAGPPALLPPSALRRKTWRDLGRQRSQFLALAATVLAGVALFAASYDAFHNLKSSYARTYDRLRFADLTVTTDRTESLATLARRTPGVAAVSIRTQADVAMRIRGVMPYGRVIGLPASHQPGVDRVDIEAGSYLDPSDPDGVLVERHAARHFHLHPGATISAFDGHAWRKLTVRGIAASPEYLWPARSRSDVITDPDSFAVIFAPEPTAAALAGRGKPNQALITVARGPGGAAARTRLAAAARSSGASAVETRSEQPSNAALAEDINGFAELSVAFPLLFLGAATVSAYVLLTRRVRAERAVIGMLRAAGSRRGPLLCHYLAQGAVAGLAGAIGGVAAGGLATAAVTRAYTHFVDVPDTVIAWHPATTAIGLAFGIVVGLAGSLAPALGATQVAPAEAMRAVTPGAGHPPGRWSRFVARLTLLPVTARLALRDVARSRRRTLATMLGAALALILVLVSGAMIDSTRSQLHRQFSEIERSDAAVVAGGGQTAELLGRVRALPGVSAAEAGLTGHVAMTRGGRSYATNLLAYQPGTSMHRFDVAGRGWRRLRPGDVYAGSAVAGRLGVRAGDRIGVVVDGHSTTLRLTGLVDEPLGTFIYTDLATGARIEGSSPQRADLVYVRFVRGADRLALRRAITVLPGAVAYTDTQSLHRQANRFLAIFWVIIGTMTLLAGALAFTTIFVTMTVNLAERTTELATLRAAGVAHRRIAAIVANENLTATVAGLPLGLAAGYFVARAFLDSFSNDMFRFPLTLSWITVALAVAAVVGAALASQLPALRAIKRFDVARVVRERSG